MTAPNICFLLISVHRYLYYFIFFHFSYQPLKISPCFLLPHNHIFISHHLQALYLIFFPIYHSSISCLPFYHHYPIFSFSKPTSISFHTHHLLALHFILSYLPLFYFSLFPILSFSHFFIYRTHKYLISHASSVSATFLFPVLPASSNLPT